jgi:biotin operon repressor
MNVLERLSSNPQTLKELAQECGLSRRAVEQEINRLRLEGFPVVTNGDGAYLATYPEQAQACANRLRRRARNQLLTARAMSRSARRMAEKRELTLFGDVAA